MNFKNQPRTNIEFRRIYLVVILITFDFSDLEYKDNVLKCCDIFFILWFMKGFELTPEEQQELREALRVSRNSNQAKASVKINALLLLGMGMTLREVEAVLFLDINTLSGYVRSYQAGNLDAVLITAHQGSQCRLNDRELEILCEELDSKIYLTTSEICDFVKERFGV